MLHESIPFLLRMLFWTYFDAGSYINFDLQWIPEAYRNSAVKMNLNIRGNFESPMEKNVWAKIFPN